MGAFVGGDMLRGPGRHDLSAGLTALRPQVDHPIGRFDDLHVVLDHEHRVAGVDQALQAAEQRLDVLEVQTGRGLVEDEQLALPAAIVGPQVAGELEPLGLPAGEGVDGLAEPDVAQAHLGERSQGRCHGLLVTEERKGLVHRQVEDVGDRLPAQGHLQYLRTEPPAVAVRAGEIDVREELHLHLFEAFAPAGLAAPAGDVEGKMTRAEAAPASIFRCRQQLADGVEGLGVGERVGPGRAADGTLVHEHHRVDVFDALDGTMLAGTAFRLAEGAAGCLEEDFFREGGFAGAGDTGQADQQPQGDADVDAFEVVLGRAPDGKPAPVRRSPLQGHRDPAYTAQVLAGQGAVDVGGGPEVHHPAAFCPGLGPEVQDEIALADDLGVVLHDHHGVAEVPQALQDANQAVVVARVQADAGLVQHVERVDEGGSEGRCQRNALDFPARQGARLPVQGEVAQAHVPEVFKPVPHLVENHPPGLVRLGDRQAVEELHGLLHVERVDLGDGELVQPVEQGFLLEAGAVAFRADVVAAITGQEDAHVHFVGAVFKPAEVALDSVVGRRAGDDGLLLGGR